jgi:hypothetical protein
MTGDNSTPQMSPETAAIVGAILKGMGAGSGNDSNSTSSNYIKLTPVSARELLKQSAADAQFTGTFTDEDVANFLKQFNAEANKQIESVVKEARTTVGSGATAVDIQRLISTSFPSFFKPAEFAKDYVWSKINFKDSATLGGKAAMALQQAKQIAADFDLFNFSDAEVQQAAKDIAMGKKTMDQFKAELTTRAKIEYPIFASRFDTTPGATTKDFASPVIKMLARYWEVDEASIPMDNEIVQKWTRAGGPDGKAPAPTLAELTMMAKNHPNAEKTSWANESARQSATSLARALGAGV